MSAIRFDNVSKVYDLQSGSRTILGSLKSVLGKPVTDTLLYALRDVSFTIGKGEAFGIIGRNGAGKSTLLKIIAGITTPTIGTIHVSGLVSSLIELGAGFHPDLTGRENIFMSGALLGIPRKKMDEKFNEIVDFAELWKFIDVPVKKYSSGMYARLGFSVAVSIEPEILIVDEILSVGDIFFQQKCFAKMKEIRDAGVTFIFVAHDTAAVQNLCDRAMLLDSGSVQFIGDVNETVSRYYATMGSRTESLPRSGSSHNPPGSHELVDLETDIDEIRRHSILKTDVHRHGAQGLRIAAARVTDRHSIDTLKVPLLESLTLTFLLQACERIIDPSCGIHLYDRLGNVVFAAGTRQLRMTLPDLDIGDLLVVRFEVSFTVSPGEYTFSLGASEPSIEGGPNVGYIHDKVEMLGPITVTADENRVYPFYGIAQLPMKILAIKHLKV